MTNEQFQIEVEKAFLRSKRVLNKKEKEYSEGKDRFDQFKLASGLNNEPATRSIWGMATKHITSLSVMVKSPTEYSSEIWYEKLTDLRNYTFLLEILLIDLQGEEDER